MKITYAKTTKGNVLAQAAHVLLVSKVHILELNELLVVGPVGSHSGHLVVSFLDVHDKGLHLIPHVVAYIK